MLPYKPGQSVRVPDGRVGRVLHYSQYAKNGDSQTKPQAVNVLFGRFAKEFPLDQVTDEIETHQDDGCPAQSS